MLQNLKFCKKKKKQKKKNQTHAWEYSISVTTKVSNEYVYPLICVLLVLFIQIYKDKASVDVS
jgi:hypothetical protein